MTAKNVVLEEPKTVEEPMLTDDPKRLQKEATEDNTKLESESKLVSKSEEKKPYPKMSLEWTNVMCDKLTDGTTRPYHILVKPNKIRCGGISVIGNSQTFAGLHRLECWKEEDPCCDWPDRHDECNLIEYNKKDKMLEVNLDKYVWDREGDTVTFDWSLFHSEAEDFCHDKGLKKILKILDC